ncbi:MAG: protease SohB [Aestuariibacter sp.]
MEFLYEYGLFLLQAVTIVVAILAVVGGIAGIAAKQKSSKGELEISSISEKLQDLTEHTKSLILSKDQFKKWQKEEKEKAKKQEKERKSKGDEDTEPRVYVIDFKGSVDAKEVDNLREEVTAILTVAEKGDEVLVRLESPGGAVHGYGLASSQLARLKNAGLHLTVAVDKVAASGGYMMASVAEKIIAAPFAYIGSIGVVAQMPNFNKLLKKNDIDFEQHTAGEFKRTITLFGENDDEGRAKFKEELEEIHTQFKTHVKQNRDVVDIDKVATGEHWLANVAKEMNLVDEIKTSDDYLLERCQNHEIYKVTFKQRKNLADKLTHAASMSLTSVLSRLNHWRYQ